MAKKILIVDDEAIILRTMQDRLKLAGYEVVTAETGKQGIALADQEKPDLIVLDVMLPDGNGNDFCKTLKGKKDFHTAIVMATSKIDALDAVRAREAGADDFTVKTSDFAPLLSAIKKLIS
jgi:DNA-binding response OmpR family regulator